MSTLEGTLLDLDLGDEPQRVESTFLGYERSSLVDHLKRAISNAQFVRQSSQPYDARHAMNSNVVCQSDDPTALPSLTFCLSNNYDEHESSAHLQRQPSSSIVGTSHGQYIRRLLDIKFNRRTDPRNHSSDCLMLFIPSRARLFRRRLKLLDSNRYPSLEQCIIVLNCLCSRAIDFYFDESQANLFLCDYLDALALKGRTTARISTMPYPSFSYLLGRLPSVVGCEIHRCSRACPTCRRFDAHHGNGH